MDELTDQSNVKVGAVRREAAFVFIFATIFLDMLAMGIVIPVLPKLVVDFVGGDTQEAARVFGVFGTAWALMQFRCKVRSPTASAAVRLSSSPILASVSTMCSWRWRRRSGGCWSAA
jgi:hypothetical protein